MTRRILIVEDDAETRAYVASGLRETGFIVDEAADGPTGLAMALGAAPDVLILDRMVPRLDGLALLKAFARRRRPNAGADADRDGRGG